MKFIAIFVILFMLARFEAVGQKASCPLTKSQSQQAVAAFDAIANFVLNEPRCVNCHGGVNPYIKGTGLDPQDGTAPSSLSAHGGGLILHKPKNGLVDAECRDCHDNMAKRRDGSPSLWMTAANFHSFVDKDAITLCKQFKRSLHTAQDFLAHIKDDDGGNNFAGTAFNGDRGLDPDQYLDKESTTYVPPSPPSISHDAFVQLGQDWAKAMGGKFQGDESCGCELRGGGWTGQISYVLTVDAPEIHEQMRDYSGHGRYETRVVFTKGAGTAIRHAHVKSDLQTRQKAFRDGATTIITSDTGSIDGSAWGSSAANVDVRIDENSGTYQIVPIWRGREAIGKLHRVTCHRETCTTQDLNFGADQMRFTSVDGKTDNPIRLQGSKTEQSSVSRDFITGQQTLTITWDLSWSENK